MSVKQTTKNVTGSASDDAECYRPGFRTWQEENDEALEILNRFHDEHHCFSDEHRTF